MGERECYSWEYKFNDLEWGCCWGIGSVFDGSGSIGGVVGVFGLE